MPKSVDILVHRDEYSDGKFAEFHQTGHAEAATDRPGLETFSVMEVDPTLVAAETDQFDETHD